MKKDNTKPTLGAKPLTRAGDAPCSRPWRRCVLPQDLTLEQAREYFHDYTRELHRMLTEAENQLEAIRSHAKNHEDIDWNGNPNWAMELLTLMDGKP